MPRYTKTERLGVNAVEGIVLNDLGWIFREQLVADMGIDAHMERVDEGNPTGKLVGVQIKTGESHFKEKEDVLVYYGENAHLDYWIGHSLPVILVAHLPDRDETFWVHVDPSVVKRTKKAWKIEIPKKNVLGESSASQLSGLFEGSVEQQRFRRLALDEPLMRHIVNGGKVSVDLERWINKSLGRTPVKVYVYDDEGNEELSKEWFQYYVGYGPKELAEVLFPWSEASVDEEFYEEQIDEDDDDLSGFRRTADEDNGIYLEAPSPGYVYPYAEMAGEVECYRLRLKLNKLGHAFLLVSEYLSSAEE